MANRLDSIWDALRNSLNPEEEQVDPISNSYSQGQGYNYPVPNEWGDSYQTFSNVDTSPMIPVTDKQVVQQPVPQQMSNNITTPFDMASIPHNTKGSMDAMDMMAMSPQNMASGASDAAWNSQADQRTPVEEPSFMDKAGDFFGDEERMARMTIALNSMRLNPDASLATSMENKLKSLRTNKGNNKTAEQLRKMGRSDLAEAVESGAMDGTTAWTLAHKAPSAIQEKIDLYNKDPDAFAQMKEAGVIGGSGVNVNMGDNDYYKAIKQDTADMQKEYRLNGINARKSLDTFNELTKALDNFGETGPQENTIQGIREMAASVGLTDLIDEDRLSDGQYLIATKNRMVAEQLRMNKGPQTDFDAEFAGTYIPGLGTSTEANTALMNYSKSVSTQQLILSKLVSSARMTNPDSAMNIIARADALALDSPAAMKGKNGKWTTFIEFYNDPDYSKNSGLERMEAWSEIYKTHMGL
jgi:hypothetical protein